jgi:hypothetical protein
MNGKAYEGLTLPGIASHIASSILLWNNGRGTGTHNDCKHAIGHNVRAYQRRMFAEKKITDIWITEAAAAPEKSQIELEHAIPVGCLMNVLFSEVDATDLVTAAQQVTALIEKNTVLVWVTKDEHAELNKRYQCTMPPGFDHYPWDDPFARYTQTKCISKLRPHTVKASEKSKPAEDDLDIEIEEDFKPAKPSNATAKMPRASKRKGSQPGGV